MSILSVKPGKAVIGITNRGTSSPANPVLIRELPNSITKVG
jgi:hypothetical protein